MRNQVVRSQLHVVRLEQIAVLLQVSFVVVIKLVHRVVQVKELFTLEVGCHMDDSPSLLALDLEIEDWLVICGFHIDINR